MSLTGTAQAGGEKRPASADEQAARNEEARTERRRRYNDILGSVWAPTMVVTEVLGGALVFLFGNADTPSHAIGGLLVAAACLFIGVLLGFLFGVPRSLTGEAAAPAKTTASGADAQAAENKDASTASAKASPGNTASATAAAPRSTISANTNLEQISDWLTKILVGVGLTQLYSVPGMLTNLGAYLSQAMGDSSGGPVAASVVLLFSTSGFLMGFLWTRLYLGGQFSQADRLLDPDQVRRLRQDTATQVDAAVSDLHAQTARDTTVLTMVSQYLADGDTSRGSIDDMKTEIAGASPSLKVQMFYSARDLRARSWRKPEDRPAVARTIPVFEGLLAGGGFEVQPEQIHAQLGYALKDQPTPDYKRAIDELTEAITLRKTPDRHLGYELNRAYARIKMVQQRAGAAGGIPQSAAEKDNIAADLRAGAGSSLAPAMLADADIAAWMKANSVTVAAAPQPK